MLNVVILGVIRLSVIMLNVVAPLMIVSSVVRTLRGMRKKKFNKKSFFAFETFFRRVRTRLNVYDDSVNGATSTRRRDVSSTTRSHRLALSEP